MTDQVTANNWPRKLGPITVWKNGIELGTRHWLVSAFLDTYPATLRSWAFPTVTIWIQLGPVSFSAELPYWLYYDHHD